MKENTLIENLTLNEIYSLTKEYLNKIKDIKRIEYKDNTKRDQFPCIDIAIFLSNQEIYISIYPKERNDMHVEIYDKRYAPPHDDFNVPNKPIGTFKELEDFILSII